MKNLLRKGQVFRCSKFNGLTASYEFNEKTGKRFANFKHLIFSSGDKVTVMKTDSAPGGWTREVQEVIDLAIHDNQIANSDFLVLSVQETGGGTGHGYHDVYPTGHYVTAKEVNGDRMVTFYQTGCFIGMLAPKDITLVSGPPDEHAKLKIVWEEE
jgi:hypothetical protein